MVLSPKQDRDNKPLYLIYPQTSTNKGNIFSIIPLLKKVVLLFITLLGLQSNCCIAQSSGYSILVSIESKANQIEQNELKLGELNRQYQETYNLESEKLATLKRELNNLIAEKDVVLEDYRQGYFCGGCGKPRSQFAPGETFPHPGQEIVPATPEQIAAKEKEYDDKILKKQQEAQLFEFSENEFTRKRADIDNQITTLKNDNERLRAEIVELSKSYKDRVIEDGKSRMAPYVNELMYMVAEQHYFENRIDIINTKFRDIDKEESAAIAKMNERVKLKNEEEKRAIEQEIVQLKTDIQNVKKAFAQRKSELDRQNNDLKTEIVKIKESLFRNQTLSDDDKKLLEDKKLQLEEKVDANLKEIANIEAKCKEDISKIEADIKSKNDKTWNLTINLPERQKKACEILKEAYQTKREVLNQSKTANEEKLKAKGEQIDNQINAYDEKMSEFLRLLEKEHARLVTACNKAACGCYGYDAKGDVWSNWESAKGCVNEMHSRKHLDVYYGCEEESAIYTKHYNGLLNGMSDSDIDALKRSETHTRYDSILNQIEQ
jgi:hypothetical protein